jgi:hypothetical protein
MQKRNNMWYNKGATQEHNMDQTFSNISNAQLRRRIMIARNLGKRNMTWDRTANRMQAALNQRMQNRK